MTRGARILFFALLFLSARAGPALSVSEGASPVRVTILHFSDYHSHALPFYDAGRNGQGGIARAIGYLRAEKTRGALVFNGGDMLNKGSPSWSDKYECAEWPWLDGVVDAMAFGNHDADYGRAAFDRCRAAVRYPILGANTAGLQRTAIVRAHGLGIGVFAVAGTDFPSLVNADGFTFSDRIAAAREAVQELRGRGANAVVMIGHEHLDDDYALARAVPGIDVIFGTHSHLERELTREVLRAALQYDNEIIVADMSGAQLAALLAASRAEEPLVASAIEIDREKTYRVAVTDYLARVAGHYRDFFSGGPKRATGLRVRDEVRNAIRQKR